MMPTQMTPQQQALAAYYARPTMQQVTPNTVSNLPAQRGVAQQFGFQAPQAPQNNAQPAMSQDQFALGSNLANNAAAFQAAANQFNQGQFQGSPQISALAKQMAANQALQRQIGYTGTPVAGGPPGQQMMPGTPQTQQAMPQQPGAPVGMGAAAPQTVPGAAQPYQPMNVQPWGGGLGGAAGSLARYYMR